MTDKKKTTSSVQDAMQKMLADNETAAKSLIDLAQHELDKVNVEYMLAQEKLEGVKSRKDYLSNAYFQKAVQSLKKDLTQVIMAELAENLLRNGVSASQVSALLEVPDGWVSTIANRLPNNISAFWQDQDR